MRDGSHPVSFQIVKSTAAPPGRARGQRWLSSPSASDENGSARPPSAGTRDNPTLFAGVIRIESSGSHASPRGVNTLASATGAPPSMASFFNWPSAKKPMNLPSGEKNGLVAFSVPARGTDSKRSSRLRNNRTTFSVLPTKTRLCPSGDKVTDDPRPTQIVVSGGNVMTERTGSIGCTLSPERAVKSSATAAAATLPTRNAASGMLHERDEALTAVTGDIVVAAAAASRAAGATGVAASSNRA